MFEEANGRAVSMEGAGVDVAAAGADAYGAPAFGEPGVDEGAEVLVMALGAEPGAVQFMKHGSGHLEGAPDPVGLHAALLDMNAAHAVLVIGAHGVEEFRV